MRVRNITTCALGLAAALTLVAGQLAAQANTKTRARARTHKVRPVVRDTSSLADTTKLRKPSEQRISISKGEVVAPRVDTVYVTRYDTVRTTNTVVRVDTVTVVPPAPVVIPKIKGPFYWAVFGGSTWPWGNIDRLYTNGFHGGAAIGLESQDSPIGFRLDGGIHQLGKEAGFTPTQVGSGTSLITNLNADMKVKALMLGGWDLYGIGGLGLNRYKQLSTAVADNNPSCNFTVRGSCYENASVDWTTKWGWNLGAGMDWHIGSQDMFFEARYTSIQTDGARSFYVPFSLGVRYF